MSSLERAMIVIRGGVPDRGPVDLYNFKVTAHESGSPLPTFFQRGWWTAEAQIALQSRFSALPTITES